MKVGYWLGLVGVVVMTLGIQMFVPYYQPKWWDKIPFGYAIYGFVGCTVIIFVSKWLGKVMIQKGEKFYDTF
jgi:hypothetical protein